MKMPSLIRVAGVRRIASVAFLLQRRTGAYTPANVAGGAPSQLSTPTVAQIGSVVRESSPPPARPSRRLDRVRDAIRARYFSHRTERAVWRGWSVLLSPSGGASDSSRSAR